MTDERIDAAIDESPFVVRQEMEDDGTTPPRRVVPRRHPWRWVGAAGVALVVGLLIKAFATAPAMQWSVVSDYMFDPLVLKGVVNTIKLTVVTMALGVGIGTLIALMRLSPNPVLSVVAYVYAWFFRAVPSLVQLIFWFNLASIFPRISIGIGGWTIYDNSTNAVMTTMLAACLGLGLNLSAYYSEIVRAGILSVDEGQSEAAVAYGLRRLQMMRHIVLPQAMRVIIPPTGNELIGLLKWTSLASVIAYQELLVQVTAIYQRTFEIIPMLIVASIWYLFMVSVLSVGQYFLEQRFARGAHRHARRSRLGDVFARLRGRKERHA